MKILLFLNIFFVNYSERPPNNNVNFVNAQVSQHLVSFAEVDAISKPFSDHLEAPSAELDAPLTVPGISNYH